MRKHPPLSIEEAVLPKAIYRYMNQEYVDQFFEQGTLLLTTYKRCREHEDAVRRDNQEGSYTFHFQGTNNSLFLRRRAGDNSYMLCASLSKSPALMRHFGCSGGICVTDPLSFAKEISSTLQSVEVIQARAVIYTTLREARRSFEDQEFMPNVDQLLRWSQSKNREPLEKVWNEVHSEHARRLNRLLSSMEYFAKPLAYVREAEFRIVWTSRFPVEDSLLVRCPGAIAYCSRLDA